MLINLGQNPLTSQRRFPIRSCYRSPRLIQENPPPRSLFVPPRRFPRGLTAQSAWSPTAERSWRRSKLIARAPFRQRTRRELNHAIFLFLSTTCTRFPIALCGAGRWQPVATDEVLIALLCRRNDAPRRRKSGHRCDNGCHSRRGARLCRVVAFAVNGGCLGRSGRLR